MRVERQMVGEQVDVRRQQQPEALALLPDDAGIFAAPEIAVMHQNRIGLQRHGALDQRQARRHPGDDAPDLIPAFDLQPVWAIIGKTRAIEISVDFALQMVSAHGGLEA
ncbi:hypothetical protein GALL_515180 [mine drainage metagenome]|uniref:Uncharacterized protein n=1 Tax=mine drainage metagenome TaxID=410659 RepID=A0A1J5PTN3_9ZZZZ